MSRRDLLKECMTENVPLEDFRLAFCARCHQPECSRSTFGGTPFDQRVSSWKERLFTQVPRMDPSDPRFSDIASKQFKLLDLVPPAAQSSWDDPREKRRSLVQVPAAIEISPAPAEKEAPPVRFMTAQPSVPEPVPEPQVPETTRKADISRETVLLNTPRPQGGIMLPGAPSSPRPQEKADPWEAPAERPAEVRIEKGGRFRLGGSGVK